MSWGPGKCLAVPLQGAVPGAQHPESPDTLLLRNEGLKTMFIEAFGT